MMARRYFTGYNPEGVVTLLEVHIARELLPIGAVVKVLNTHRYTWDDGATEHYDQILLCLQLPATP